MKKTILTSALTAAAGLVLFTGSAIASGFDLNYWMFDSDTSEWEVELLDINLDPGTLEIGTFLFSGGTATNFVTIFGADAPLGAETTITPGSVGGSVFGIYVKNINPNPDRLWLTDETLGLNYNNEDRISATPNYDYNNPTLITSWDFNFYQNNLNTIRFTSSGDDISPVPEPTTMLLFGAGLAGLAGISRRKRK
ncbi:PEP-CTERM sorting domain-containing protein [Desulfosediminicola flagellatus]|uniref:PEP-CTERM sorting domain-containing protein n=1 Tax=Desulfosediminicola flagellatus TaxID=2569541 RepID=UPI0010AB806B|nr:PEP-CTERM sorting domain-containing protein [Desulfosediminicola flagellatus]